MHQNLWITSDWLWELLLIAKYNWKILPPFTVLLFRGMQDGTSNMKNIIFGNNFCAILSEI